jgi:putative ATP-binding cassette transporter
MNLLRFLLRSSRGIVLLSAAAGGAGGLAGIALIALIRRELASETSSSDSIVWIFIALCLLSASARFIGQASMIKLGQNAILELAVQLVKRTLRLPLRAFESIDTAALLAALTEDVVLIANAMVGAAHLCTNIPIVIACVIYLGWLSPTIFASGVLFAVMAIAVSVFLSARGVGGLRQARRHQDALVGHFRTLIDGFRELKLHAGRRAAFLGQSLEPTAASVRGAMIRGLKCFAIIEGWNQLAFFGFIGILLFIIPRFEPVGRPTLVSAVLVVLYLMSPLDVILTWLPILGRARASLLKIEALIPMLHHHRDDEPIEPPAPARRLAMRQSVCLDGVTFTYRDAHDEAGFSLGPVDLTLRPGEMVILAGGNGSGKTTLVKLFSGLYQPDSGAIRLDGRAISHVDREAFRQLFSVVFADGYLFPDFRGLEFDGIESRAQSGLDQLGLAPQVSVQGRAFSTVDLSQGQRRRLALLGVLLENRPICIFDEWAANQDPSFRQIFYSKLLPELRASGKALLVISHDESQFYMADRVVHLQDGRLLDEAPLAIADGWASGARRGLEP